MLLLAFVILLFMLDFLFKSICFFLISLFGLLFLMSRQLTQKIR